ncbi:pentatricopeptide repeat-containing protein At4g20740 [Phoenix dactylifera]|uniref:Pentatricopeptide repeat-containing protein At4g20740 n=1 Tax=Phoenix dactylifera TaxID=42345 RepID=A0A8B9AQL5_PHODC|nr:pentatricopeptide repeat-containing protein At4g20740 [Phoenix dactylifera]XP_038988723.1 pentatricopeptide repeat-containing protein At4g20740 [Phoenix dactylifera]XP_038988724.1 pentatricopeptide repeat-containing protein At4g20740 [Phoenix dactylifera]XP_038988725.1 pentatricopeptide repeat-containing protein At4g20740 [Phoenix dactylifera]
MPPATPGPPAAAPRKYYFFYGHRKPSQNRPVVRGGFFSNRKTLPPSSATATAPVPAPPPAAVDFRDWDPDRPSSPAVATPPSLAATDRRLCPLARYILDSLRRHRRWCPPILSDLRKLRRVPPDLVAEVLRARPLLDPAISTRFFHWAGSQKGFRHTFASYNALAYALNAARLFRVADQIPELMDSQGQPPSEKQLEILVRLHADAGRGLRIFHIYQKMRSKFGVKPRIFLYNRILDALIRTGHLDLALLVYDDLRADGLKEEAITFTILAKGLCRAGRIDQLLEILDRMRQELCRPDVFVYTAMVKALALEGNLAGCLRVWEEMKKDRVEADVMAYKTLVSGLCKAGKVEKARELFQEMKMKGFLIDQAVYGSLVDGCVAEGKVGDGCQLLKEMVADGYRADLGIYNSLIEGFCGIGRVDKAYKLFRIAVQEGLVPGFESVTPLLASYADANDMDKYFHLVDMLGKLGLPVMDHLSNFFTFFIEKGGTEFKALEMFEALKGKGFCSIEIYNILIACLHKIKERKRALLLFEEMKNSKDFSPDSCSYSHIIPCLVEEGNVREACSCFNLMKEMSWTPNVAAYCSLVEGLCRIGEINAALSLVKDCLGNVTSGPMEFKYALTVLNACRSKNPEKVVEILDEMMEQGYPLEDIVYCAIIHGFCKYASSGEARKVFAVMRDRKILSEVNFIVYEELLNEHLKKITAGLVVSGLKFFGLESKLKLTSNED